MPIHPYHLYHIHDPLTCVSVGRSSTIITPYLRRLLAPQSRLPKNKRSMYKYFSQLAQPLGFSLLICSHQLWFTYPSMATCWTVPSKDVTSLEPSLCDKVSGIIHFSRHYFENTPCSTFSYWFLFSTMSEQRQL